MAVPESEIPTELARDIAYALKQSPFKVKGQPIESLGLVARAVVAHLRRCGWHFELAPPAPGDCAGDTQPEQPHQGHGPP